MKFYSTNNKHNQVSLKQAVIQGLADDGGLFMPAEIPSLSSDFFQQIHLLSFQEIALEVAHALMGSDISTQSLKDIVNDSMNFPIPLVKLKDQVYVLELFHGPTLAFKDVGARFMARLLSHFLEGDNREVTVLVATSGDTGSAVANGFLNVPNIKVVILYPKGKVSEIQEKQLTTLGENITALEVKGTFDDCQRLVKQAFNDKQLKEQLTLTSANSINVARLIPQSFYYFYAYAQLPLNDKKVVISVPSGNFGNLTGGLLAKRMGLPIDKFIAATNVNDIVPHYLLNGIYSPKPSMKTISNAMDVGTPSNFDRIMDLFNKEYRQVIRDITGYSSTDDQTKEAIKNVYQQLGYLMDPHGAVGFLALEHYLSENKAQGIFLETAHPAKFCDVVQTVIGEKLKIPVSLEAAMKKEKQSIPIDNTYPALRQFLVESSSTTAS